ncbi:fha domain-containing protein : FHA domain-containing protein OS=Singulisphaera acidiphila (strain ATCC BAA-1392 / DSM 18658 / VKM B-2454 / MOB10) GN=Sinac_5475 PE=4 SV=1: FHA: FHA [Gemmata massiliana]|uniref:FHA domain-containing protein n=1 Tax=Gemmata massiliana TaxID=1210884 RepID=A0A6P2D5B6_9BACT|nr:FHA domain-containing protein [Gemmata massiliana]VTR95676.1 fha domain-containing protein : FHA domain-containing protein OS=Singulisphaera acidiphila (strain ATCC BAA-1392 / DSM 18658 / VKM B-2454 / MOB10) GN=Sinac_5475 PE=4 SV=1: FHA: FHA [Gemmata massiliana]
MATRLPGGLDVHAVHRTSGEVRSQCIGQSYALLGRAPRAGVRLDDPSVSQCHAYLQLVDGVPYCIDLGSRTGVLWDDGGQGRGWIHPGQTVRIGMFDVQITATGELSGESEWREPGFNPDAVPLATLDVHAPGGPNGRFALDQPVTLIGRHPNCNLRFLDEAVAYFQCAIVKTREGIWCVDLLSRGGTVLNGRPTRVTSLRDGDLIELGKISLLLRVGPSTAHPPVPFGVSGIQQNPFAPVLDTTGAAGVPLREMMEQFQQCFVTMARMFTTMQQEHTAMMCEQMRQVQELIREARTAPLSPAPAPALAAPTATTPPTVHPPAPRPVPRVVDPAEAHLLADAHAWFFDRLVQKTSSTNGKKSP